MDFEIKQLCSRAHSLAAKFRRGEGAHHIDNAIALDREAVQLCPSGHPLRPSSLNFLGIHLWNRYEKLGVQRDLDEAILIGYELLQLCPRGRPDRLVALVPLASRLAIRYQKLKRMSDLNTAVALTREACSLFPARHPLRAPWIGNLAFYLSHRHDQLGALSDLDDAIFFAQEVLRLLPLDHQGRSGALIKLASYFSTRFERLGEKKDVDEAVRLAQEALLLESPCLPDRPLKLWNLVIHLLARYVQFKSVEDLEQAIIFNQEALNLIPLDHPDRSTWSNTLANSLCLRYKQFGKADDIEGAIVLDRQTIALLPRDYPRRALSLSNLANHLLVRYNKLKAVHDLDEGIAAGHEALTLLLRTHPQRSKYLRTLASLLSNRFARLGRPEDKEALFSVYVELAVVSEMGPSSDLSTAKDWVCEAARFSHPSIVLAYETSLRMLARHLTTLSSSPQHIVRCFASTLGICAFTACLRSGSPAKAVELLEQGRGISWALLSGPRALLDDVSRSGPPGKKLVEKFMQLTELICQLPESHSIDRHHRVCLLILELEGVVSDIRKLPAHSRFLLSPLFPDLRQVADWGPVVIVNACTDGCDALILLPYRDPVHVPLQITRERVLRLSSDIQGLVQRARLENVTGGFIACLRELWNQVVFPIAHVLQQTCPPQSRVWWCPTAEFSCLPLHAAGPHCEDQLNFSDVYVSSYTPTLAALIRARRPRLPKNVMRPTYFVAIGRATADRDERRSVSDELDTIAQHVDGLTTRLDGAACTTTNVSQALRTHDWVHLACHGDGERPLAPALALHDGRLSIAEIMALDLDPAFMFLSAGYAAEDLGEAVHLASAMQWAGFRSVVGKRGVDDVWTARIVAAFYARVRDGAGRLNHGCAARALQEAMRAVDAPLVQRVLYVHYGA